MAVSRESATFMEKQRKLCEKGAAPAYQSLHLLSFESWKPVTFIRTVPDSDRANIFAFFFFPVVFRRCPQRQYTHPLLYLQARHCRYINILPQLTDYIKNSKHFWFYTLSKMLCLNMQLRIYLIKHTCWIKAGSWIKILFLSLFNMTFF